jgi:NADPH:quinone reductase-like Zn-dependent oxidoreductase
MVDALNVRAGEPLLINGAGGVTGGMLIALAVLRGAEVIATAGPSSRQRVRALGARHVIEYHGHDWPDQAIRAVADGGRLATITSDPPSQQRGIAVSSIYVRSDGDQLRRLAQRFGSGQLEIPVAASYRLADAAQALAQAAGGHAGGPSSLRRDHEPVDSAVQARPPAREVHAHPPRRRS